MYFVVLLPDGTVVVPKVENRLRRTKLRCGYFFWPDIPSAQCVLIRGFVPPYCLQCAIASLVAASALD
jgi:hypothetical protein